MKHILLFVFIMSSISIASAQEEKTTKFYKAPRLDTKIKIDGRLDESVWLNLPVANEFIQLEPAPGKPCSQKTEVKVFYDDKAFYVGANLFENNPDSILRQLSQRDEVGITDWFSIVLDAYQDGLNGVGFLVTSGGVQLDIKYLAAANGGSNNVLDGDVSWDAVWESSTQIHDKGWTVEIKIPYSAIRFPNAELQNWNINFCRMIRGKREQSYWSEVRPELQGLLRQSGQLVGLENIKAPVRLSATPYLSAYLQSNYDKNAVVKNEIEPAINGGMDIKYGINDAFTLDMTLIPDFGQVQADNEILNLSPFEVQFEENRPFFTEGIELFNKGGLFYSRRIGGRPIGYNAVSSQLHENEELEENPLTTNLINATKLSGRTNSGLGVGVFNATSRRTFATVKNTEDGTTREIETSPLTNFNVFVLDQNLKNNSYVSLINTNVLRSGATYDANVTGTQFELNNAQNTYRISGGGAISQKYYSGQETVNGQDSAGLGYNYRLAFDKTSGQFQYGVNYEVESRHYDINDLGILFAPNERLVEGQANYSIFKPFGAFNRFNVRLSSAYLRLQNPDEFVDFNIQTRFFMVTRNFVGFGLTGRVEPVNTFDYFDPRTEDFSRFYLYPKNFLVSGFISTDYRKRVALDMDLGHRKFNEEGRKNYFISFRPRFRPNDKLMILLRVEREQLFNDVGFIGRDSLSVGYSGLGESDILYSIRDQVIFNNILTGTYAFTNKSVLSLRVRHYWTKVKFDQFNNLGQEGQLEPTAYTGRYNDGNPIHDTSFNIFSVDMVYRWRFAPGSDLFIVWKNNIRNSGEDLNPGYFRNFTGLFEAPQLNSLSFRLIYFLDYLQFKRK